jgi:hypothetical protein
MVTKRSKSHAQSGLRLDKLAIYAGSSAGLYNSEFVIFKKPSNVL